MRVDPWVFAEYLVKHNLKRSALADKAEVCTATINNALKGKRMNTEPIYRIAKAMGVKPQDLL